MPGVFAATLIPIAVGYTIAHYFSLLFLDGQIPIALASDPFQKGWNLFGTANLQVNYALLSTLLIACVQIGAVVLGHVLAVVSAHDRALVEVKPVCGRDAEPVPDAGADDRADLPGDRVAGRHLTPSVPASSARWGGLCCGRDPNMIAQHEQTLSLLLDAAENSSPVQAVESVTRALRVALGATAVSFLIADLSGRALVRLAHVGEFDAWPSEAERHDVEESAEVLPFDGGPGERALRTQNVQVMPPGDAQAAGSTPGRWTVLAPVTERGEAVGLLEHVAAHRAG